MKNWKLWLPDVVVVLLFVVISFAYFFPADIEGRVLYRHDSSAGRGAGQEATEYLQRTGERTRWTNALFGGMPTYQMSIVPKHDTAVEGGDCLSPRIARECVVCLRVPAGLLYPVACL